MFKRFCSWLMTAAVCLLLLAPAARTQTWTRLTNSPPSTVNVCFLLTDGGVMCQSGLSWYKLTPDASGSYISGTWSRLASLPATYGPEDYAAAVLADGRVAIVGGEYNLSALVYTNMGAIYDPATNSWSMISPPNTGGDFQCIGDVSSVVLPNGKVLIGSKFSADLALLNPATLKWTAVSETGKNGPSNAEEGWTLLPDGSIFTVNVAGAPGSQRLLLSATSGTWVSSGVTLQDLHAPPSSGTTPIQGCPDYNPPGEMGPAILRPDGTVFAIGASGFTGIYTPPGGGTTDPGNWATGPSLPAGLNVEDGPAALLPNGHVLFSGSPGEFGDGVQYFEFDGTNLISVPAPAPSKFDATFQTQLLLLPTGQVLFVDASFDVEVYTPAATPIPNPSWAPTITSVPASIDNLTTYQITGTQFNGLSQGTSFGDELQNATNYPLVRITNNETGHVFYAKTHDHSTMAVATGQTPVSTNFDVPGAIDAGDSTIQVVANGIASPGIHVMVFTPNSVLLTITTVSLPTGQIGAPYSFTLNATGGIAPLTWQVIAGSLPAGLTLNSQTGQLSGTPTSPQGPTPLTFQVTDSSTPSAQIATVTLNLAIAAPLSITTTSLPSGSVSSPYSAALSATGGLAPYSWQLSSGSLPNGLSLNAQTGQISGTPTVATSTQLTFSVTDSSAPLPQTAAVNLSLTVSLVPLVITLTSLPDGQVSVPYSANLTATGGTIPYTWALVSGTLPAGLTLNTQTGQIGGTPTAAVLNAPLTFKVTDSGTPTPQTTSINLKVSVAAGVLTILTTSLPNAQVNVPYSASLAAVGGLSPLTWSSRGLPAGFSLNPQTGQLTGTATNTFTMVIPFTVTDSSSSPQSATVNLNFAAVQSPVTITTASLPPGQVNVPYSATLGATGGMPPYTWQLNGTLPNGMTFNSQTGVLGGTPSNAVTNAPLTFTVTDSSSPAQTATVNLSLTVAAASLVITSSSLPPGQVGVSYTAILAATGGTPPYTWQLISGTMPGGLILNSQTGQISGTPTTAFSGTLTFKVTDSKMGAPQTASAALSLIISGGGLTITTASLPVGQVNVPYSATLMAVGGMAPYLWSSRRLPAGFSLNSQTGQLTGTPSAVTTGFSITVTVTDSSLTPQSVDATFSLTVVQGGLNITTALLPAAQVNVPYSATLTATGGLTPYTWQLVFGALPNGLSLNATNGQISGVPTVPVSNVPLTFRVTDSSAPPQTASANLSLTVNASGVTIATTTLPNGQTNVPYSATLFAIGGIGPYNWQLISGALPSGLTLNSQTGQISGTPANAFSGTLAFKVTDSSIPTALTATASLSLTITGVPANLTITTASLPNGQVNVPYSATLAATGGLPPYTWSTRRLPSGLSLNSQTGQIQWHSNRSRLQSNGFLHCHRFEPQHSIGQRQSQSDD